MLVEILMIIMIYSFSLDVLECTQGNIRPLVGGASSREGLVEVCAGGRFLPVAMDNFTITEASVMCRQLELGSGEIIDIHSGIMML